MEAEGGGGGCSQAGRQIDYKQKRERQRDGQRDRQTGRQSDRETDRETERRTQRQTEKRTERQTQRQTERQKPKDRETRQVEAERQRGCKHTYVFSRFGAYLFVRRPTSQKAH